MSIRIPIKPVATLLLLLSVTACGGSSGEPTPNVTPVATNTGPTQPEQLPNLKLPAARAGFSTKLIHETEKWSDPPDDPGESGFKLVKYQSPAGELAAYLTTDPGDGQKHPVVIWCKGGFGGIGAWLWQGQERSNDQSARAFLESEFVVMCPSWRAENGNPGRFEFFYGEVDDLLAALEFVKKLPYVDPARIYLAGHSTGGTLALLGACSTDSFRAVFSFGGAPDVHAIVEDGEGWGNTPYDYKDKEESRLRSPIHFVGAITSPTFYFEGEDSFYPQFALRMERTAQTLKVPFQAYEIRGGNHFNILYPIMRRVAKKIAGDTGDKCNIEFKATELAINFD